MEAVIFIGIQAVGKSTFYHERFDTTHVRLNLDMLKTRHREKLLLEACLAAKQSFVVDNTNVTTEDRVRYTQPAKAAGFRVIGYYFRSTLDDAKKRNRARDLPRPIPDKALGGTYNRLQAPTLVEGFDALYTVTINLSGGFIVKEWENGI
jgi:predicted kinase